MKPLIFAAAKLSPLFTQALTPHYEIVGPMPLEDLMVHPARAAIEVIAGQGESRVRADMMDALPALKLVSIMGVGYDGVDVPHALQRGAKVSHTPQVLNDDVADLAIGLMLSVTRRLALADRYVRQGSWSQGPMPLAVKLSGLRLGLVGMGRIGQAIAKRALAFQMPIAYTARSAKPELPYKFVPTAQALAAEVDVLCVITPGGASTFHMINADVLQALGPKGYLVNVARGSVVDEQALVAALQAGHIAGAALDVFEDEPRPSAALLSMDQVVLAPHIGSATHQTRQAMAQLATDNIHLHFAGSALKTPVPECQS